ncbi:hypothetical protein [Prochlorococcus marinus]|uniref:Uncharacterized protein n=1 Tax=Prochlorococcus marinus (strain MIT 9211) TaxID=93059 RepID=A9BCC3_PROM4|nr:hypothetical protein [Prochlorococcus marinus]ABX09485.1 Hypothetical protein P9211_15541 [Prochlorococcus marinus str. MIT 9211]
MKVIKKAAPLIFLLSLSSNHGHSTLKKCDVIYGERIGEKALEEKHFKERLTPDTKNKYGLECYQIGVEHDDKKAPLPSKPIYACCQKI